MSVLLCIGTMKNRQSVKADILKTGGNSMEKGDFSQLAEDYANFRPGYNLEVVKHIIYATGLKAEDVCAADIGAGTGIFSKCLSKMGVDRITAVEPNDEMRQVGDQVNDSNIKFLKGAAEDTNLPAKSYDLISMASSFHWVNYKIALKEFSKLLKSNGVFTALWNPRLTERSEVEDEVQTVLSDKYKLSKRVSSGRSGVTEKLREILQDSGYFTNSFYIDAIDTVHRTKDEYLGAWRSVNDIQAQLGIKNFNLFLKDIEEIINKHEKVEVHYLTRAWIARKR